MDIKRQDLFCKDCMSPGTRGFKKIIGLKNSGLLIYLHRGEEKKKNAADKSKTLDVFILHNNSEHDLRRPDYAIEMCQLRTRCFRCINIVKRVRSLLDEFNFIKKNQVIGLCDHCKRNPGACKRCQYIVNKFLDNKTELYKEKQDQFKSWLRQLNQFLHNVLKDENLDRDQINSDPSALELESLLEELKQALQLRKLHTTFFPTDLAQLSSMSAGNEMIDELLDKIKLEDLRKLALDENLPPIGEGMQLLPKEHQKGIHRQLPSLTQALQKKSIYEWIKKDNVSENQLKVKPSNVTESQRETKKGKRKSISDVTSKSSASKPLEKDNATKNKSIDKLGNVTEAHRKEGLNKEKNKAISQISSKSTTSKPIEKDYATKKKSKDKPGNITETHRNEEINKEKNKVFSEISSKGTTSKLLEKDYATKKKSKDKPGNITETHRKEEMNKEKNKVFSEISSKGISSKPLEKDNATKNKSKDRPGDVTETHRKEESDNEKNKSFSEISSKGTTSHQLEKDNATKNKSKDKPGIVPETERKEDINREKNKPFSEISSKGTSSKPLEKDNATKNKSKVKPGNVKETHKKEENKNEQDIMSFSKITKEFFSADKDKDLVKVTYSHKGKNNAKENYNPTSPYANMELPLISILGAGDDKDPFSVDSSYIECDQQGPDLITEMIKRTKLVSYDPHYKDNMILLSDSEENNILPDLSVKQKIRMPASDGVLRYRLSDKTFIKKGYTILPVIKVMKRINLYKMEPVNPQFNWFKRHKDVGTKNYDTGEILAVINENGTGKWFYKNGRIALDYYNAEDVLSGQRYVLYSSGEESYKYQRVTKELIELNNRPQVLGVFDFLGNGVVYDLNGNERIKFNQTEGVIMDSKIAPVSRWKWNSLNDPPQLESILIDNYDCSFTEEHNKRHQNPEVLRTELQNYAKQKAHKLLQKFKPFQIRMKAFKINDEFSLRIVDQANIYLLFRHGTVSMKLNLGLDLVSNEIVDTDAAEIGGMAVATPYDRIPARTSSIANIQHNLQNVRNLPSRDKVKACKTPSTLTS